MQIVKIKKYRKKYYSSIHIVMIISFINETICKLRGK